MAAVSTRALSQPACLMTKAVMIGPTIPDRLPIAFCTPTQVPDARGPANICATA